MSAVHVVDMKKFVYKDLMDFKPMVYCWKHDSMLESCYQSLKAYRFLKFWAMPVYFIRFIQKINAFNPINKKRAGDFLERTPAKRGTVYEK